MKLSTFDVATLHQSILEISQREGLRLPVRVSFTLIRNLKETEPIYTAFISARALAIRAKSQPAEDNPDNVWIDKSDLDIINQEIETLGKEMVDVNVYPIKLSEIDNLELTIQDLTGLYPIIENEGA